MGARRLTDNEAWLMAGAKTWEEFGEGDSVRIFFTCQDPLDAVVIEAPDRNGWVKVKDGEVEFLALAACCVKLDVPEAGGMSGADGLGA